MTLDYHLLPALGPLALAAVSLWPGASDGRDAGRIGSVAEAASLGALAAVMLTLLLGAAGVAESGAAIAAGDGILFDRLSAIMLLLVAFVGWIVMRYSRRYLDGDPGQTRFYRWLSATLAAVLTLVMVDNLILLAAAWVATSLCLHQLLVFYPDRPRAVLAARKKFIISRIGDACMLLAVALTWQTFGTVQYQELFAAAELLRLGGEVPVQVHLSSILLVTAAVLKSAQFPFHGWLTVVMETGVGVSMTSSSQDTQPIPASMVATRSLGCRSSTPDAQRLATGSWLAEQQCTA